MGICFGNIAPLNPMTTPSSTSPVQFKVEPKRISHQSVGPDYSTCPVAKNNRSSGNWHVCLGGMVLHNSMANTNKLFATLLP